MTLVCFSLLSTSLTMSKLFLASQYVDEIQESRKMLQVSLFDVLSSIWASMFTQDEMVSFDRFSRRRTV